MENKMIHDLDESFFLAYKIIFQIYTYQTNKLKNFFL